MSESPRKAFDLTAVVDKLDRRHHKDLIRAIRAFHAVESVELDLIDVAASVKLLKDIDKGISDTTSHTGSALLTHAVIIYARATHSQAISRFNVGVTGAYNDALKARHLEIIDLRNKCIAHFGPGKDLWHDEHVIYVETAKGNRLTVTHRRTNFSLGTIENLGALVAAAIPHVKKLQLDRAAELASILRKANKQAWNLIDRHEFDLEAFFSTPEMKGRAWEDAAFTQNVWETKRSQTDDKG
ncbi:hypothetical protein BFX40_21400 [Mesorhizobium sp. SEMIA 3007]|uniref:hypothetical protein n=1 Tax=Mesorhizobium sp. SEMIA 3007 TaxID=1862350 RepID=UPI00083CFBE6|nr:hypothetical protein [Mesorhizobium sp. SEMIA 3007]ODA95175.1 hypothetical protein BFX40_21400 [Mesorhizobium sp. SEMIA 3007]